MGWNKNISRKNGGELTFKYSLWVNISRDLTETGECNFILIFTKSSVWDQATSPIEIGIFYQKKLISS